MPRPAKFSTDNLLDAALVAVAARGRDATVADVSEHIGAPVGSIYHRFGSREQLFVSLWVRSIRRFHAGLLMFADGPDAARALEESAVHVVRYCRDHTFEARALTLYRQSEAAEVVTGGLRESVQRLNDDIEAATRRLTSQRYGRATRHRQQLVATAVRQLPYGLVRPYIGVTPVPRWLDDVVRAASRATLALGDSPS